jgi:hypothetical protein
MRSSLCRSLCERTGEPKLSGQGLVQSGQITPEVAQEIMQSLQGGGEGGGAEGGAGAGAPPMPDTNDQDPAKAAQAVLRKSASVIDGLVNYILTPKAA